MSLRSDIETAVLDLVGTDVFGRELEIDGVVITAILEPDVANAAGAMPGQIVQRYRLICQRSDFSARVGSEIEVDDVVWTVVDDQPLDLLTCLTLERYTA